MTGALTGAVAGLATVTPAAGFVEPWAAGGIGLLAAVICYYAVQFRIKRDWDDALDVWGVHGVGGALGVILTGVFASTAINSASGLSEGNWKQFKGQVKEQWGKLTHDQLDTIAGKRDDLVGKIQETYGITKEATEKQVAEWQRRQKE